MHQRRDAVAVIQHALAHHLGRVCGQHRHDQGVLQQSRQLFALHALRAQKLQRRRQCALLFSRGAPPVFGEVRQHGKQHEAAHERDGLVERQSLQPRRQTAWISDAPIAIHGCGADGFDPLEHGFPAKGADHAAQQPAEESHVGVLRYGTWMLLHERKIILIYLEASGSIIPAACVRAFILH